MNLELDGCAPYEEDGWSGAAVRVGTAVIRVLGPVPRCVATTRDPETGAKDFDTLKAISAYRPLMANPRGVPFGMYAEVETPGRVAVGDEVVAAGAETGAARRPPAVGPPGEHGGDRRARMRPRRAAAPAQAPGGRSPVPPARP